jgi:hypothetical protein
LFFFFGLNLTNFFFFCAKFSKWLKKALFSTGALTFCCCVYLFSPLLNLQRDDAHFFFRLVASIIKTSPHCFGCSSSSFAVRLFFFSLSLWTSSQRASAIQTEYIYFIIYCELFVRLIKWRKGFK